MVRRIIVLDAGLRAIDSPGTRSAPAPGADIDLGPIESVFADAFEDRGPGTVFSEAFWEGGAFHQVIAVTDFTGGSDPDSRARGHALIVDMRWVDQELADLIAEQQSGARAEGSPILQATLATDFGGLADRPDIERSPAELLSFVRVRIDGDRTLAGETPVRRSLVFNAISSGLFLSVIIVMGVHIMRARKALELAERRSAIVGSASHALRTPLTIISLYADTLAASNGLNESDREYSEIIARESTRMLHQVEDGLNFARIAAGRQTYRLVPSDLNRLVQSSFSSYERYLETADFIVEADFSAETLPLDADDVAIGFALDNMIQNAIKYSGDARYIGVRTFCEGDEVVVEISDRGVGIPLAEQDFIFDEFYRASTSVERRGWGLGLYIVKHVVDGHSGRIEIDSQVNRGTRVRVRFPRREPLPGDPAAGVIRGSLREPQRGEVLTAGFRSKSAESDDRGGGREGIHGIDPNERMGLDNV
jgi:signal transduction histidine kinase